MTISQTTSNKSSYKKYNYNYNITNSGGLQVEVDNLMVMPEYNYKFEHDDDVWSEKEDRAWEDLRDNNFKEEV